MASLGLWRAFHHHELGDQQKQKKIRRPMKKKTFKQKEDKVSDKVLKMEDADNVTKIDHSSSCVGIFSVIIFFFLPGCWRPLPHHGHDQAEEDGGEGAGDGGIFG